MKKAEMEKIISEIKENSCLTEDDYFTSVVFYYLSGRYPRMPISECTCVVDELRKRISEKQNDK